MTRDQLLIFLMGPLGGAITAAIVYFLTRSDLKPRHPKPGE